MSSALVEFATRSSQCERRLLLAESDRRRIGDAIALLFEDPTGASPAWPAAVSSYSRIWAGYKSFEPIMPVTDLLDHVADSLRDDAGLVAGIACWTGRELWAWALPAALILVRRGSSSYVLEDEGFRVVTSRDNLLRSSTSSLSSPARGRLRLSGDDVFVIMPRVLAARTGLWRFEQALVDQSLEDAVAELAPEHQAESVVLARLASSTVAAPAASSWRERRDQALAGISAVAAEPALATASGSTDRRGADTAPELGSERTSEGAATDAGEEAGSLAAERSPAQPPASPAPHPVGEPPGPVYTLDDTIVEPAVAAITSAAGAADPQAQPAASALAGDESLSEVARRPYEFDDSDDFPEPGVQEGEALADDVEGEAAHGAIYIRQRRSRQRSDRTQGTLFRGEEESASNLVRPLTDDGALEALRTEARSAAPRRPGRPGNSLRRSLTWAGLGTAVVVVLTAIIVFARLISSQKGGDVVEATDMPPVGGVQTSGDSGAGPLTPPVPSFAGATWTRSFAEGITSSPALDGERVIFGGRDGNVYALDIHEGTSEWETTLGSGVGSSPAVADGRVFLGTYGGAAVALDAASGERLWSYKTGGRIVSSPAVTEDDIVVIGSADRHLYGLSVVDGSLQWKMATGGNVWASPTIDGAGRIIVGSHDRHVYGVHARDGKALWKTEIGGKVFSSAACTGDRVVVGSTDGRVHCLDANNGESIWTVAAGSQVAGSVTALDDVVLVGTDGGTLLCLALADGGTRWSVDTGRAIKSRPRVVDGQVWFTGYDTLLRVLDLETGAELWSFDADGQLFSSPAVLGRTAFFGSMAGSFYAATWSKDLVTDMP